MPPCAVTDPTPGQHPDDRASVEDSAGASAKHRADRSDRGAEGDDHLAAAEHHHLVGDSAAEWDQRYAGIEQVWSGRPNAALVSEVTGLEPGRALDVGMRRRRGRGLAGAARLAGDRAVRVPTMWPLPPSLPCSARTARSRSTRSGLAQCRPAPWHITPRTWCCGRGGTVVRFAVEPPLQVPPVPRLSGSRPAPGGPAKAWATDNHSSASAPVADTRVSLR